MIDQDGEAGPKTPTRRRSVWPAVVAFAALAGVTGVVLHGQARDARTPEAAALAYAQLVADGEIEAATALVPIGGSAEETDDSPLVAEGTLSAITVDAAILSDAVYADAEAITDVTVELTETADGGDSAGARPEVPVGGVADVVVRYSVSGSPARVILRVQREADAFSALPRWRVLDSLAQPVAIPAGSGVLGEVRVEGVAVAPPEGLAGLDASYGTVLYPGAYEVTLDPWPYAAAAPLEVRVAGFPQPLAVADVPAVSTTVSYYLTAEAFADLDGQVTSLFEGCADDPLGPGSTRCPSSLTAAAEEGGTARITRIDQVGEMSVPRVVRSDEDELSLVTSAAASGTAEVTGADGSVRTTAFAVSLDLAVLDSGTRLEITRVQQ